MASPPATPLHLSPSNVETEGGSSSRSNSPDGNCPICLGKVNNKAFTDACFHTFCFVCLLEWSKIRPTCPLCKTTFKSIIHNVVSNDIYDQYHLKPADTGSFGTDGHSRRFRYSTTLTEEHRFELTWRRNRALERRYRRAHQIHLQAASEERRRMIYRAGLWVRHIGSNRFTRFRDISPDFFRDNPATTHRLVPWLRRELGILFSGEDHVTFMTQYILSLIPNVHLQTEEFHEHLRPFLYGQTEHFIHEFVSFARSPYDMGTYDQIAQYDLAALHQPQHVEPQPLPSLQSNTDYSDVISLSSDDEVIEVPTLRSLLQSDSTSNSPQVASEQVEALDLSSTHNPEPPRSHQSDPDRPGPSGISSNQVAEVKPEHMSDQENIISDDNSDIEIVGVVKPYDERTPECVILLSSSTEEDEDRPESRRADKEGGKRHQKRKHTERHGETSHLSKSSEHGLREESHRRSHKKHKESRHHKHSSNTTLHFTGEHSRTHHQHPSKKEHTSHKHHKRSRSRSQSKSSSSSYHTWKSSFKESTNYSDDYSKKASSSSTHFDWFHSRDTAKQRTKQVHYKATHKYDRRHGEDAGGASHGAQQRANKSEGDSWMLQWHDRHRDVITSDSADRFGYSKSSGEDMTTAFSQHSHGRHYQATLSRKHKTGDSTDDGERTKIRRPSEDSHSSSLHLTMVFSRTKTRTPDGREKSSSSTDGVSLKSSHGHHRKHKKHKRHKTGSKHKRHRTGCTKEKPKQFVPYTLYSSVYGNEEEGNEGDESCGSTEEEDNTFT